MGWKMAGEDGAEEAPAKTLDEKESPSKKRSGKEKRGGKRKKLPTVLVVLVAIFLISRIGSCMSSGAKKLEWPTSGLATVLPQPPTTKGEVHTNSDDKFRADLNECSESQFSQYVQACKDKGFVIDSSSDTTKYQAFSEEGYKVELSYYSSGSEISVTVDAPIEMTAISWPATGAASYVPAPVSTTGKIDSDSSTFFYAYVGDTDAVAYGAYVDACMDAGYNIDYHKGSTSFYADNASGVHLSVDYEGFNTITVRIDASEMTADTAPTEAPSDAAAVASDSDGQATSSSSDVREALDAYESFMNDYCDFMEEYQSEGKPASMLGKYGEMMTKYADMMAKFDAIDEGSLSAEDDAYYLQVQARVNQRLLAVAAQ